MFMYSPPRFLLSLTILFWGWQTQLWFLAIPMACIAELVHWVDWRWAFTDVEFNRLVDMCSVLWIGAAIYLFSQESVHGLFTLLGWLPALFYLLLAGQLYSTEQSVRLSSLFLSLRKKGADDYLARQRVDVSYPYLLLCLLSASTSNHGWFFLGAYWLVGWALWCHRPRRYAAGLWVVLFGLIVGLSYVTQQGIYRLQGYTEEWIVAWFQELLWAARDPYRQVTAIGDIQDLKLSDRIVLRVSAPYPLLLREASYNRYYKGKWYARDAEFFSLLNSVQATQWVLVENPPVHPAGQVVLSTWLPNGSGVLALPTSAYALHGLSAISVKRNSLGAVKVEDGAGFVNYVAYVDSQVNMEGAPTEADSLLPENEAAVFKELAGELGLAKLSPVEAVRVVEDFFAGSFAYSLDLKRLSPTGMSLEEFLREYKAGHCEYFATATVLLLRAGGVPARYVSGYAAEEFSEWEQRYVVRRRHAHAWVSVFLDNRWVNVDTTPATWVAFEEEQVGWWVGLYDVWAYGYHAFEVWRWQENRSNNWLIIFILPLFGVLVWRVTRKERLRRGVEKSVVGGKVVYPGMDSDLYAVLEGLYAQGYVRAPHETLRQWVGQLPFPPAMKADLWQMVVLHERYRFDPAAGGGSVRVELAERVAQWVSVWQGEKKDLLDFEKPSRSGLSS